MSGIIGDNTGRGTGLIKAAGGGVWTFISKTTISADATVDIESGIDSTYPLYAFVLNKIIVVDDDVSLEVQVKVSSFQTGSDYRIHCTDVRSGIEPFAAGNSFGNSESSIPLTTANLTTDQNTECYNGILYLPHPSDTARYKVLWHNGTYVRRTDGDFAFSIGHGGYDGGAGAVTGLRFYASSGDLTSGTITLYGIKDS